MTQTNSVEIRLLASNGVFLDSLSNQTNRGELLDVELSIEKVGGVKSGNFTIKNIGIDLSSNVEIQVFRGFEDTGGGVYRMLKKASGFIDRAPLNINEDTLSVSFLGYWEKFKQVQITENYTNKTILEIITDLFSKYTFFERFDDTLTYVVPPTLTIPTMSFEKTKFDEVLKTLLEIANYDYNTTQYTVYLNENNQLVFKALTFLEALFEGYDFQDPKLDFVTPTINRVVMYTRDPTDTQKTYFRGTVTNGDSVSAYGLLEKTIIFPAEKGNTALSESDTNAIVRVSKMIVQKHGVLQWKASLKNLTKIFEQGFLRATSKFGKLKSIIMEGDSLSGWDFSGLVATTVSLDTSIFLFGTKSIKFSLASGSLNEEAIYNFNTFFGVFIFEIYVYLELGASCRLSVFNDVDSKAVDVFVQDEWVKVQIPITLSLVKQESFLLQGEYGVENPFDTRITYDDGVDSGGMAYDDGVDSGGMVTQTDTAMAYDDGVDSGGFIYDDGVDSGYKLAISRKKNIGNLLYRESGVTGQLYTRAVSQGGQLYTIDAFKVKFLSDAGNVYLDRASLTTYSRLSKTLTIEQQKIKVENGGLFNDIILGERADSLVDEIGNEVKKGDTSFEFLKGV